MRVCAVWIICISEQSILVTTLAECVQNPQSQLNIGETEVKDYTQKSLDVISSKVQNGTNISQCCEYNNQILDKFCAVQRGVRTHTNTYAHTHV